MSAALLPLGEALRRISWPGALDAEGKPIIRTAENGKKFAIDPSSGEIKGGLGPDIDGKKAGGGSGSSSAPGKSFADYQKEAGGNHSKAAKEFYRKELKGHPTKAREELENKPVAFIGGDDQDKFFQGINDPAKAEAIQHVRDVIETGTHHGPLKSYKREQGLADKYSDYHYFQKEIPMNGKDGKPLRLMVDVGKTKEGNWEYIAHNFIHSDDVGYSNKLEHLRGRGLAVQDSKKRTEDLSTYMGGVTAPRRQEKSSASDKKISPPGHSVNSRRRLLDGLKELLIRSGLAKDDEWITMKGSKARQDEGISECRLSTLGRIGGALGVRTKRLYDEGEGAQEAGPAQGVRPCPLANA